MACCLLPPSAITVYCNCHRHQHFQYHSDNSVGTHNFLERVALIPDSSWTRHLSSPTQFHFLNSPRSRAPGEQGSPAFTRTRFDCHFIPGLLVTLDFYTFTPGGFHSIHWMVAALAFIKLGINLYLEQRKKSLKRLNLCCYNCCEFV